MPGFTGSVGVEGPTFTALFGHQKMMPVSGLVLVDTGASRSAVNERIVKDLGLVPVGWGDVTTPGNPIPKKTLTYQVNIGVLTIPGHTGETLTLIPNVVVFGNVALGGIDCLLGRDILKDATLFYNGPSQTFTIGF